MMAAIAVQRASATDDRTSRRVFTVAPLSSFKMPAATKAFVSRARLGGDRAQLQGLAGKLKDNTLAHLAAGSVQGAENQDGSRKTALDFSNCSRSAEGSTG